MGKVFRVLLVLALFVVPFSVATEVSAAYKGYARPDSLITAEELKSLVDAGSVKVLDVRPALKYRLGHIPESIQVHRSDYNASPAKYDHTRPGPEQWKGLMDRLGIRNEDTVILYDDGNSIDATRLWWIFKLYGHKDVRILDGTYNAWTAAGYDTQMFAPDITPSDYVLQPANAAILAEKEEVLAFIGDASAVIVDTRSQAEHTGAQVASGAGKGGRIPGSVWIEWTDAVKDGFFLPAEELKAMYAAKGVVPDKIAVPYCQGGVRGAHTHFVLSELLGFDNVKLYDLSWLEWSNEDLPYEKD